MTESQNRRYSITITTDNLSTDIQAIGSDIRALASDLNPLPNLRLLGNKPETRPEDNKTKLAEHMTVTPYVVEPKPSSIDLTPYYASGIANDLYRDIIREPILSDVVELIGDHQNAVSSVINQAMSEIAGSPARQLNTMHISFITRREVILIAFLIIILVGYKYYISRK